MMLWVRQLQKDPAALEDFQTYLQREMQIAISDGDKSNTLEDVMVARGRKFMLVSIENQLTAKEREDRALANFNSE